MNLIFFTFKLFSILIFIFCQKKYKTQIQIRMTYSVELLLDLKKNKNIQVTKDILRNLAIENNCSFQYFQYEISGEGRQIKQNICIHKIDFDERDMEQEGKSEMTAFDELLQFIKQMIMQPIKHLKIDNIYNDAKPFYFLFKEGKKLELKLLHLAKQKDECMQLNRILW